MARHFPLGRRHWLIATALATALGVLVTTGSTPQTPAAAAVDPDDRRDDLKDRKADVNDRLHGAHSDLDESSAQLQAAVRALTAAQQQLAAARSNLARTQGQLQAARELDQLMQERLADAERRLEAAEDALVEVREEVAEVEDALADFVVASYEYGNPSLASLGVMLEGGNPSDFEKNLSLADTVINAQSQTLDDLKAKRIVAAAHEDAVEQLRDEVALRRAEAAENLVRKKELKAQAVAQTQQVRALVEQRQVAEQRAEQAKQVDLDRIQTLEAKREQIKDRLQRIANRLDGPDIQVNNSGGWLSWPVSDTYITSPYGMRFHPILHYWKLHDGTDFGAGCGTPVYAAAAGSVVSAYYDSAYGNRITIAHGSVNGVGLATSYNHLTSFAAGAGEHVSRGELIGYAGTTGWSTGCHLHFMVYENGSTVDPMSWL
jgi:murein DD-endopeptidase MepM/ murein hydrolase activator NlpD